MRTVNGSFEFSFFSLPGRTPSSSATGRGVNACIVMQRLHLQLLYLAFSLLFHEGVPLSLL